MKIKIIVILFSLLINLFLSSGCSQKSARQEKLVIVHAGSLSIPLREISNSFMKDNPGIDVMTEAYGSRTAARQVSDLGRSIDIVASADSGVIRNLLYPEHAGFCIDFTTNRMVIAGTRKSRSLEKINRGNWYRVFIDDDVEFGYSNPNSDPCGYRSVLTMKLAELYYKKKGLADKLLNKVDKKNIRPKEVDLLALLEAAEIDYIFIYKSVASQHHLKIIELPEEIDLGSSGFAELYKKVFTEISGKKPGETIRKYGKPMVYGLTIPFNAPHKKNAVRFFNYIFGPKGRSIMKKAGQPLLLPPKIDNLKNLPRGIDNLFGE